MAFQHGKDTQVLVGQYDLSAYFTNADIDSSQASHDVTTFSKDTVQRSAGLRDGKVSIAGLFDAAASVILSGYLGSANGEPLSVVPDGGTAGGQAAIGLVRHVSFKTSAPVGGMVTLAAALEATGAWEPNGVVLHTLHAETVTGNETTVHDVTAATLNGGVATIHCTAFTGTSLAVKVQHSTNGTDWLDLSPTFTTLTGVGSEQILVAAGTTVNQYLRAAYTIVGTTMTFFVAFARK